MVDRDGRPRVVVTGLGVVAPLGIGPEALWAGLMKADSATARISRFDPAEYAVQIACQVDDFQPRDWMEYKDARRFDRVVQFAVAASRQAIDSAQLFIGPDNADRVGVIIGSGIGGLETIQTGFEALFARGPMRVPPLTGAMMLPDMASGQVAITFGARGPNFCVVSACATGSNAVGEAAEVIWRGDADVMRAGSPEAGITPVALAAFPRVGATPTRRAAGGSAAGAPRPVWQPPGWGQPPRRGAGLGPSGPHPQPAAQPGHGTVIPRQQHRGRRSLRDRRHWQRQP